MKEYLVTFNSTRWAGSEFYKIVKAENLVHAEEIAEIECNDFMSELYSEEDAEEDAEYLDAAADIISIETYDKNHPLYQYRDSIEN